MKILWVEDRVGGPETLGRVLPTDNVTVMAGFADASHEGSEAINGQHASIRIIWILCDLLDDRCQALLHGMIDPEGLLPIRSEGLCDGLRGILNVPDPWNA